MSILNISVYVDCVRSPSIVCSSKYTNLALILLPYFYYFQCYFKWNGFLIIIFRFFIASLQKYNWDFCIYFVSYHLMELSYFFFFSSSYFYQTFFYRFVRSMFHANKYGFILKSMSFIYISCSVVLAGTSVKRQIEVWSGHSCFRPSLKGKVFRMNEVWISYKSH